MQEDSFSFTADDGHELYVRRFRPAGALRGVVHIAHGMAEHGGRYARVAGQLTQAGDMVYANDHRGHGKTAKTESDLGFFASSDGFRRVARDLAELVAHEKKEHPGLPLVFFGHSMGSYFAQALMIERGAEFAGVVLSGSSGKPNALASAGRALARLERFRLGERGKSKVIDKMTFGAFNAAFEPTRTQFDWLSTDPAEVDKYIDDPLCGFVCTTSLWVDLLDALGEISRPDLQARVPKDLPVYIFAGQDDPVGEMSKSVWQLIEAYRAAGLKRVTHRFYPGRHEMLNEVNRDEVTRDLLAWLATIVPATTRKGEAAPHTRPR